MLYWMMQQLISFFNEMQTACLYIYIPICDTFLKWCAIPLCLVYIGPSVSEIVTMPCQAIPCLMLFGIFFSSFLLLLTVWVSHFFYIKRRKYKLNQLNHSTYWNWFLTALYIYTGKTIFAYLSFTKKCSAFCLYFAYASIWRSMIAIFVIFKYFVLLFSKL